MNYPNTIVFTIYMVHFIIATAAVQQNSQCILDDAGHEICTPTPFNVNLPVRQRAPCSSNDWDCWCIKAVQYTNAVRRKNGRSAIKVGAVKMLENARAHSREMVSNKRLYHQDLGAAARDVRCSLFIRAENVAYNYERSDIAKACVDQWEGSSGHLRNMLSTDNRFAVVGFARDSRGRVYCTQTFAVESSRGTFGDSDDNNCKAVDGSSSGGSSPSSSSSSGGSNDDKPTKPSKPTTTSKISSRNAKRACRCVQGSTCRYTRSTLRTIGCRRDRSGKGTQPSACVKTCCDYCEKSNYFRCRSSTVRAAC